MSLTLGAALGIGAASGLVTGIANIIGANAAYDKQIQGSKELWDYQWNKANSPQAQVRNLTKAGLNPAAMFGNQSPVMNSGGSMAMPSPPNYNLGVGTQSLSDLAQYIAAGAQEKKTGADVVNVEVDTELKKIQAERERFQNDLLTRFGLEKGAAELALAQEQVRLAKVSGDEKKQDIAIKTWTEAKEKAISECNEAQRDILLKELANKDVELDIRNRAGEASIGEIKSRTTANYASAEESHAHARDLNATAEGKELLNNISRATNLTDIDNAIFNSDTLTLMQQSNDKEKIFQELVRNIKVSSAYKNSDTKVKVDASLQNFGQMLGIPIALVASMVKGVK